MPSAGHFRQLQMLFKFTTSNAIVDNYAYLMHKYMHSYSVNTMHINAWLTLFTSCNLELGGRLGLVVTNCQVLSNNVHNVKLYQRLWK